MKGKILWISGLALIAAALCLTVYNIRDGRRAESYSRSAAESLFSVLEEKNEASASAASGVSAAASEEPGTGEPVRTLPPEQTVTEGQTVPAQTLPDHLAEPGVEMPSVEVDGMFYCALLEIPSVGISLPVCSDWSMDSLRFTPCRYSGSAYAEDMVIAAHNYKGHFSSLADVLPGDPVTLTDMDGNSFHYTVSAKEVLPPTAVGEVTDGAWPLTLFTCTVGGQNRVVVRCDAE